MVFLIGDVQGCDSSLAQLLELCGFSPSRDRVVLLGDVVNRGPDSLAVLRRLQRLGNAAVTLLGNHDLHLLAVAHGVRPAHRSDTIDDILTAPDRQALVDWVRQQKLAHVEAGWLCVHAGVLPQWSAPQVLELAGEVEQLLRGGTLSEFLPQMYGNLPDRWRPELTGADRWRCVINALTRLRLCRDDGTMEFKTKEGADAAPAGYRPWFEVPGRLTAGHPIAFGHWSTLGPLDRADLLSLDSGCVWGGALTAARVDGGRRELLKVPCPGACRPGDGR
jgi:bis(5'-nucleosyl)-tetraphosphatase (symmetrical)